MATFTDDTSTRLDDTFAAKIGWDYALSHTVALTETWIKCQPVGQMKIDDVPNIIRTIYGALRDANTPAVPVAPATPTVEKPTARQIRDSITDDALISFEDGKKYKMLRRHLGIAGLTPQAYREKWGLPNDYPMTAPGYSARRSELAKANGLGRK